MNNIGNYVSPSYPKDGIRMPYFTVMPPPFASTTASTTAVETTELKGHIEANGLQIFTKLEATGPYIVNVENKDNNLVITLSNGKEFSFPLKTAASTSPITVNLGDNIYLGDYYNGDIIPANTPLEDILASILTKTISPTYTNPTISIENNKGTEAGEYEYGTIITPKVNINFTQNDAGDLVNMSIFKNDEEQISDVEITKYTEDPFILSEEINYTAQATYAVGIVKNNSKDQPDTTGQILAGTIITDNYTYTPYYQGYFWGILNTSSDEEPITSDIIREGNKKNSKYESGQITGIKAIDVPYRKRIFIACPANEIGLTKVLMPSAAELNCISEFIKQDNTITVKSANDTDGIEYNVWVYEPAEISDDQTFTAILG